MRLITPEQELLSRGKAKALYLNSSRASSKDRPSEVVFKNISHLKGGQSASKLINYITRHHHDEESQQETIKDAIELDNGIVVRDEHGHRLAHSHIEAIKSDWNEEFSKATDKERVMSHFVFSSDKITDAKVMADIVHETLQKTLGQQGFRYIIAVHDDTDNMHCHVAVNAYSPILNRKINVSKEWIQLQRQTFAELSQKRGYNHVATMKKWRKVTVDNQSDDYSKIQNAKVVDFGDAHYEHDKKNNMSYFVTLDNGAKIWGIGLKEEIERQGIKKFDTINIDNLGSKKITTKNKEGNWVEAERVGWKVTKSTIQTKKENKSNIFKSNKKKAKDNLKFEVVKNSKQVLFEHGIKEKAADFVRLESEITTPNPEQQSILSSLKKDVPKKYIDQAKIDYQKSQDPIYQSKLKQVRFLESRHKKQKWKESFTFKLLELDCSTTDKELKKRITALYPKDVKQKTLVSQYQAQRKLMAEIQSIPLQRQLSPKKVPALIQKAERSIASTAMNRKYEVQLRKSLEKHTEPERQQTLNHRIDSLQAHLKKENYHRARQLLSNIKSSLKGQPRSEAVSKLLKESADTIQLGRARIRSEIKQLHEDKATLMKRRDMGSVILEHGTAPYQHKKDEKDSYYMKLENGKTLWGVGLKEAIQQSGANIGDKVFAERLGRETVTVKNKKEQFIQAERVQWSVIRLTAKEKLNINRQIEPITKKIEKLENQLGLKSSLKKSKSIKR